MRFFRNAGLNRRRKWAGGGGNSSAFFSPRWQLSVFLVGHERGYSGRMQILVSIWCQYWSRFLGALTCLWGFMSFGKKL